MSRPLLLLRFTRARCRSGLVQPWQTSHRELATLAAPATDLDDAPSSLATAGGSAPAMDASTTSHDSLFENYSEEYAKLTLGTRTRKPFNPPWPSLFPPLLQPEDSTALQPLFSSTGIKLPDFFEATDTSSSSLQATVPCDVLGGMLAQGNLAIAAQLRDELLATETPILPRPSYLNTAIRCLRQEIYADKTVGKRECLAWFRLWYSFTPSQAANETSLLSRNSLKRLSQSALSRHGEDVRFLSELLMLSAKKGVLDETIRLVLPYVTHSTSPTTSHQLLEGLVRYVQRHGPNDAYDRRRRWYNSSAFFEKVRLWRNIHLKALMRSGQWDAAQDVFTAGLANDPPVVWARHNKERLAQGLLKLKRGKTAAQVHRQKERDGELGHQALFTENGAEAPVVALSKRILKTAHLRSSQPVSELVSVLSALAALHPARSGLLERLRSRYVSDGKTVKPARGRHQASDTTASFWHAAEITRLQMAGEHVRAILLFASKFHWNGLPSWNFLRKDCVTLLEDLLRMEESADNTSTSATLCGVAAVDSVHQAPRKLLPTAHVVTIILPSILRSLDNLSKTSIARYHAAFCQGMASSPPSLRPDAVTHLQFIRAYSAQSTSTELEDYATQLESRGVDIGHQGWAAVALALAKERQISRLNRLLKRLRRYPPETAGNERQLDRSQSGPRRVVPRTYLGAAITLLRKKETTAAKKILRRMEQVYR